MSSKTKQTKLTTENSRDQDGYYFRHTSSTHDWTLEAVAFKLHTSQWLNRTFILLCFLKLWGKNNQHEKINETSWYILIYLCGVQNLLYLWFNDLLFFFSNPNT